MNKQVVEIFTDGACKGNPGPGGWGAILRSGEHYKEIFGGETDTTNNRMELKAAIEALKCLRKKSHVILTTDSNYLKKGIESWIAQWKKNNWKTAQKKPVKNQDLWEELDQYIQLHEVEFRWVKGHAGHAENELADQLANRGVEGL